MPVLSVLLFTVFDTTVSVIIRQFTQWGKAAQAAVPHVIAAVVVVLLFYVFQRLVRRPIRRFFAKTTDNAMLAGLFASIALLAIRLFGLFLALIILKLDQAVLSLLAGLGLMGVALGFAFQDIAANFISGIIIAFRRPYRLGDVVAADGYAGTVIRMNLRSTIIKTFQGPEVVMPNRKLLDSPLTNFSNIPKRRVDLQVGVGYDDDLQHVTQVTRAALEALPGRDPAEPVAVWFEAFGDSAINLTAAFWIDLTAGTDFADARSAAVVALQRAYAEAGVNIPYPTRTLLRAAG